MSLTSHLNDSQSPVKNFFLENLPNTHFKLMSPLASENTLTKAVDRKLPTGDPLKAINTKVSDSGVILPSTQEGYPWMTVGTAIDYRIRYFLEFTPLEKLVAYQGAEPSFVFFGSQKDLAKFEVPLDWEQRPIARAFRELQVEFEEMRPLLGPKKLSLQMERRLAQLCYVLAIYEDWARSPRPENPIAELGADASLEQYLLNCREDVIDDLVKLAAMFFQKQKKLMLRTPRVLNPTFAASGRLGGADADLILGHRLIDIKTTKNPNPGRQHFWQLAGYVLADLDNQYEIEEVGFYYSRQGSHITWSLQVFLDQLAGEPVDLVKLRKRFDKLLGKGR